MTTGQLYAVTMWTFKCDLSDKNNKTEDVFSNNTQHTVKQLMSIEQELNHLQRLEHPNLVHYLNMTYSTDDDNVIAYVLQEFVVIYFFILFNIYIFIYNKNYIKKN